MNRKPNVILILTDDQGFGDLSIHGNSIVETPNIDRLANEGIRLDNYFATPLCAPTRAGLLTGRYHPRTGVTTVTAGYDVLSPNEQTLGDMFKSDGYRTGIFGKWHSGWSYPSIPQGKGFDEFVGFRGGHHYDYFDSVLDTSNGRIKASGFITDVLTDHALDFISRSKDEPFFCYIPYNAIHTPIQCPNDLYDKYMKKVNDPAIAGLYAMSENVDQNVGRIMSALDEYGISDDTIVIYMTDNGPAFVGGPRYNAQMIGSKGTVYEGGVRVPCFIRYPRKIKPESVSRELCAYIDILPTLRSLCGIDFEPALPLDGIDISEVLTNDGCLPDNREVYIHTMYVEHVDPISHSMTINQYPGGMRTKDWKYLSDRDGVEKLYYLPNDNIEIEDLINAEAEKAQELKARYNAWLDSISDGRIINRTDLYCGYTDHPETEIPAQYAMYHGDLHFCGKGFEYDYLLGFASEKDYMSYEVNFVESGSYDFSVLYNCDGHPRPLTLMLDSQKISSALPPFNAKPYPLDTYRVAKPQEEPTYKDWNEGHIGSLRVEKGLHTIRIFSEGSEYSGYEIQRLIIRYN